MPNYPGCRECAGRLYRNAPFLPTDKVGRKCLKCEVTELGIPTQYRRSRGLPPPPKPVAITCEDCPLHTEAALHPDLFRMNGKPLHCNGIKKGHGCPSIKTRNRRIAMYRRVLAAREVEVEASAEMGVV